MFTAAEFIAAAPDGWRVEASRVADLAKITGIFGEPIIEDGFGGSARPATIAGELEVSRSDAVSILAAVGDEFVISGKTYRISGTRAVPDLDLLVLELAAVAA